MPTLHNRTNWAEAIAPGLRKYLFDAYKSLPDYVPMVFNMNTSSKAYEEDRTAFGVGLIPTSNEGATTPEDTFQDAYTTRYTHLIYKKKIPVTKELADDDQYGIFNKRAAALGKATMRTINNEAYSVFRNAFSTSYTSYGDTKPLCSISHTRADGGTAQSNASATGIILGATNLWTGIQALRKQLDDRGQLIAIGTRLSLLIPVVLEKTAQELLKSELVPDSANNNINYYKSAGIDTLVIPWIGAEAGGSDSFWFLLARGEHQLNFFWRERPKTWDFYNDDTDTLYVKVYMRFSYGWSDSIMTFLKKIKLFIKNKIAQFLSGLSDLISQPQVCLV